MKRAYHTLKIMHHFIAKGREVGIALIECRYNWIEGFHDVPSGQFPGKVAQENNFNPSEIPANSRPNAGDDVPF